MALIPVPDGHLGTVVTYLEMTARPLPRPVDARHLRLKRWPSPEPAKYRRLFRRVGTRWLMRATISRHLPARSLLFQQRVERSRYSDTSSVRLVDGNAQGTAVPGTGSGSWPGFRIPPMPHATQSV